MVTHNEAETPTLQLQVAEDTQAMVIYSPLMRDVLQG